MEGVMQKFDKLKFLIFQGFGRLPILKPRQPRSCQSYPRSETWFADMWGNRFVPGYQGDRWKCDFRMTGEIFDKLVTWLTPRLEKQETFLRQPILVMKRVAIALWRLATGDCFRSIGKTFGVGKSTCVEITHEFCKALVDKASEYIKFHETALEVGEAIQMFKDEVSCKIPQAFAAVDGAHIEIGAPDTPDKADYFARTKRYAVYTQGIIGANLEFFHISTGFPGSFHDARMWRERPAWLRNCKEARFYSTQKKLFQTYE